MTLPDEQLEETLENPSSKAQQPNPTTSSTTYSEQEVPPDVSISSNQEQSSSGKKLSALSAHLKKIGPEVEKIQG